MKNNFPSLSSVIIGTSDIQKAKEFYVAVFGIIVEIEEPHYISAHGTDGTHIEIETDSEHRFPNWVKHNVGTYKNSEFGVEDIHEFMKIVEKHGGKVINKPEMRPWGPVAEIADLDGNIFLITQKQNEK